MLGHSAISELPISTLPKVIVSIVIGGKPLTWVLTRKSNSWEAKLLENQWIITKRKQWSVNNRSKQWDITKSSKWYK